MKKLSDLFRSDSLSLDPFTANPYRSFLALQRQMDRLADEVWSGVPSSSLMDARSFSPSAEVTEGEGHYLMSFDLPGVKKEDVKIDLQSGLLTISSERTDECEQKGKGHYRGERFYGSFSRTFPIPEGVKPEQIEASYADGVLRVVVPKVETAKAQQIKIGEGKPGLWDKLLGHKKQEAKSASEKAA